MGKTKKTSATAEKESLEDALKSRRRARKGHRAYLKQIIAEAKGLLQDYTEEQHPKAVQLKGTIEEQLDIVRKLDEEILKLLVEVDEVTDDEIAEEVTEAGDLRGEGKALVTSISDLLQPKQEISISPPEPSPSTSSNSGQHGNEASNFRVKLPKLEVKRFSGKVEEWQEFWDSFESAIHTNSKLSPVDKFSYLRGLLVGTARTSVAGLALTSANYGAAIDILKRRFGKKVTIERAHVNDLLTVHPVFNEKDTVGLRKLYDTVEVHYRGLQALGVNASTYEGIVVPAVLGKLPEAVRLQITRGKKS